jgi:hypothetical protein
VQIRRVKPVAPDKFFRAFKTVQAGLGKRLADAPANIQLTNGLMRNSATRAAHTLSQALPFDDRSERSAVLRRILALVAIVREPKCRDLVDQHGVIDSYAVLAAASCPLKDKFVSKRFLRNEELPSE